MRGKGEGPAEMAVPGHRRRGVFSGAGACRVLLAGLVLAASALAQGTGADGWRVDTSVSGLVTFSDNIDLEPSGDREAALVFQVSPALSVHGAGARVKLDLDYAPQFLWYTNDGDTGVNHRLATTSALELLEDHLFLDLRAGATRVNASPTGRYAGDGLSGNLTQSYYMGASPTWRQHFGGYADGFLRYSFDRVIYTHQDRIEESYASSPYYGRYAGYGSNSNSHGFEVGLESGRRFSAFGWSLQHSDRKVDYDESGVEDPKFRRTHGRITYPLHRLFDVYVGAGYDDNDYDRTRGDGEGKGWSWEAGGTWRPREKSQLTLGGGNRYFGHFWNLDLRHQSRRTVWTARYSEDVTTSRDVLRERQLISLTDPFGNPIVDPLTHDPLLVPIDIPSLSSSPILRKRFDAGVALQGRRTNTSLNLYRDHRESESGTFENETVYGTNLRVSHQLSRETSGRLFGTVQYSELEDNDNETLWYVGAGLRHRFSEDVHGTLDVRHTQNRSDRAGEDYKENRITAGVTVAF